MRRVRTAVGVWFIHTNRGAVLRADPVPDGDGTVMVADSRGGAMRSVRLSPTADAALRYFARPRPPEDHPPEIAREVADLLAQDFLVRHDGGLLSVVTRPGPGVVTTNGAAA
jgi:hypothetical protein